MIIIAIKDFLVILPLICEESISDHDLLDEKECIFLHSSTILLISVHLKVSLLTIKLLFS